jgi:hypothetical protein
MRPFLTAALIQLKAVAERACEGKVSSATLETEASRLDRARSVFEEMQRRYTTGNFTRCGELLQQLEKLLGSP